MMQHLQFMATLKNLDYMYQWCDLLNQRDAFVLHAKIIMEEVSHV